MNRSRWCLLIAAVPIVLAAQFLLRYREASVLQYLDRPDGSGAAVVNWKPNQGLDVLAWDRDFKNTRTIHRIRRVSADHHTTMASDPKGNHLVLTQRDKLLCIDVSDGATLWESDRLVTGLGARRIDFIDQGRFIAVSLGGKPLQDDERASLAIIDAKNGQLVNGGQFNLVSRYLARRNRMAIQYSRAHERFGQWDLIELRDSDATLIKSFDFIPRDMAPGSDQVELDVAMTVSYRYQDSYLDRFRETRRVFAPHRPTVRTLDPTTFRPARFEHDSPGSSVADMRVQYVGYGEAVLIAFLIGLATAIWSVFLVFDGQVSTWQWRPVSDAFLLSGLLVLLLVPIQLYESSGHRLESQPAFYLSGAPTFLRSVLPSFLTAAAVTGCLAGLMWRRRPLYLWVAVFVSCALPVLLPTVAMTGVMMHLGYRFRDTRNDALSVEDKLAEQLSPPDVTDQTLTADQSKIRFGIREVMLATTAVAIFISIGLLGSFAIPKGCLLAGLIAIGVLVTEKSINSTAFFLCVFMTVLLGTGHAIWRGTGTGVFAFAVPMFITFAAMYGFRVRAPAQQLMTRQTNSDDSEISSPEANAGHQV